MEGRDAPAFDLDNVNRHARSCLRLGSFADAAPPINCASSSIQAGQERSGASWIFDGQGFICTGSQIHAYWIVMCARMAPPFYIGLVGGAEIRRSPPLRFPPLRLPCAHHPRPPRLSALNHVDACLAEHRENNFHLLGEVASSDRSGEFPPSPTALPRMASPGPYLALALPPWGQDCFDSRACEIADNPTARLRLLKSIPHPSFGDFRPECFRRIGVPTANATPAGTQQVKR
jgi:hypothetical protein